MADEKKAVEKPLKKLFWLDMEMTGLDENTDVILEVAVIITDMGMNELARYEAIVYQPPEAVAAMNEWCKKTHGDSGLTKLIPDGTPLKKVEADLIALATQHFNKKERIILCGNSIGNDRRFIDKYMKDFAALLHYRLVDVSSFKEIFKSKFGINFQKKNAHRAIGDICESIEELKTYLSFISVDNPQKIKGTCLTSKNQPSSWPVF